MIDHDSLENSVAAAVLGALDAEEGRAVLAHAEGCPSCRELAARLRRAVAALPLAVEPVRPPDRLRASILEAARSARPASTAGSMRQVRVKPPRRPPFWERFRLPQPRYGVYAAVAACFLVLGIWNLALTRELRSQGRPVAQVSRYALTADAAVAPARGTVLDLKGQGVMLVEFAGLPQPPPGRVYEIWLIGKGAAPEPAAVFTPDGDGSKLVVITRGADGYRTLAVTTEQGPGGSSTPTETPRLQGQLA